ncbi:hypothetical protein HanPI659440_Chr10g0369821 [Helianthus annuus]|nr:hypothetical protein HanPI659440_Chr10g0369821 [Helianthus annuus]
MSSTANLSKRTTVNRPLTNGDGWGMGFLLIFFPHQHELSNSTQPFKPPTVLKRSNSTNIVAKAQSTISVCALVLVFTLLLFTLSTFEPTNTMSSHLSRRHLSHSLKKTQLNSPALQGLGTLYSRGTKAMNDVVLCHVPESVTLSEIKSFIRAFHISALLSKSDLVFIFPSMTSPEFYDSFIRDEFRVFVKLIRRYKSELSNVTTHASDFPASFDVGQFVRPGKASDREPIWGRKIKSGVSSNSSNSSASELTRTSYGSVVGFGVGELDPENALSGFMEHVPMGLRRWATYPMLLGRVRRNFKHVVLVDVKEVLLVGDPLARVRNGSPETVFLSSMPPSKHHRKSTDRTVNPSVVFGGARGVRRLSTAMLTDIVRATTHNKRKSPVTESALLSRLVASEVVNKNIQFVASAESVVPEASSLGGVALANYTVVRRGNSNIDIELTKHICSFTIEASVYTDCRNVQPF